MAQIYGNQGDYEKSLELHFFMAEFFERKNKIYPLAVSFGSIANILRKIKRYEDSKKYQRKSLDILKAQGLTAAYAMGLQNLANVYVETGDNDMALQLYKEALQVIRQTGNKNREGFILTNMGYLFGELHQFEKAIEYQIEAVSIWKRLSQHNNMIESLDNLGSNYLKLKQYDKAESFFLEALPLTKEAGSKTGIAELYRELYEVYVAKGDYKKAYAYNNRFLLLKDSIFSIENAKQISELQTKYETEKKDQQITLLAQEKEVQQKEAQRQSTLKNASIGGVLLIALLAGLILYTLRQRLKNQKLLASKNEEIKETNFKRQLTELEMKALQAQINPHFIFNCMNSINQMILDGDNQNASKYLTKFGKLIRMVLENAESTEVSLKDEL
ncbi:MAG TPA: tetratricopeptide repeat protein, partial [Gillisia sp.]|nr:tetratricopeptide repeat protein [Gillisia sp.]